MLRRSTARTWTWTRRVYQEEQEEGRPFGRPEGQPIAAPAGIAQEVTRPGPKDNDAHLQVAQVILSNIETNIPNMQYWNQYSQYGITQYYM